MVDDLKKKGSLTNCMAISDVLGSMRGDPMEVSVALGLLISELADEPWKGKLITFTADPELHVVEGDDLRTKTRFVRRMRWGLNTDFQKVFDVILKVAVEGRLKPEKMIKRVFVFSDIEFDVAASTSPVCQTPTCYNAREYKWETNYEAIARKYREKGYGDVVPEIVFWNLRDSRSTPVLGSKKGVALVSGYSKNLIKLFLDNDGEINPMAIMEAAISGPEYSKLEVIGDSRDEMAKVGKPEVKTRLVKKHLPATLCSACKNRACKNRVKKKSGPALHGSSQSIALRNSFHMLESDEE